MPKDAPSNEDRIRRADPAAVATARELATLLPNDAVILFGSRARGDHRPDSDMDLLVLGGMDHESETINWLLKAGDEAATKVYGNSPHPEVQVVPMHTATYQRTKNSRNFLAGHIRVDAVVATDNAERWKHNAGDLSLEPLYARQSALEALQATTTLGEWRVRCPEEEDDLVLEAQRAIFNAHLAVASQAGLTIGRKEELPALRARLGRRGWPLPKTLIRLLEYSWYDKHDLDTIPPMLYQPKMTALVRRDVEQVLATAPTLHRKARTRWERWKRSRRNSSRRRRDAENPAVWPRPAAPPRTVRG